jgi:hypothetical protein
MSSSHQSLDKLIVKSDNSSLRAKFAIMLKKKNQIKIGFNENELFDWIKTVKIDNKYSIKDFIFRTLF